MKTIGLWFLNQRLSRKLLTLLIISGTIPVLVLSLTTLNISDSELRQQAFAQLNSVREIKTESIERYFRQVRDQVVSMSQNPAIIQAMSEFSNSFYLEVESFDDPDLLNDSIANYYENEFAANYRELNSGQDPNAIAMVDLLSYESLVMQYHYISNNDNPLGEKHLLDSSDPSAPPGSYHDIHARNHPYIREFLNKFGYYDIFLIDLEQGNIVYSVFKELDFATSLIDGPYADTNFANAYRQATELEPGESILLDFATYKPSYEAGASFIAAPIFSGGLRTGVLVFQVPLEHINNIMDTRAGMGETGESYLVGPDNLMRSDSYLDPDHHSVQASFRNPETGSIDTAATKAAFRGESGSDIVIDYNGNPVLSSYGIVDLLDFEWAILAEIDEAEAFAGITNLIWVTVILVLVATSIIVAFGLYVSKALSKPILDLAAAITKTEDEGIFSRRLDNLYTDEVGDTSRSFNKLLDSLSSSFQQVNTALHGIGEGNYDNKVEGDYCGELEDLQCGLNRTLQKLAENDTLEDEKQKAQSAAIQAQELAKQVESQSRESTRIKQALDVCRASVLVVDNDQTVIYINESLKSLFIRSEEQFRSAVATFSLDNNIGSPLSAVIDTPELANVSLTNLSKPQSLTLKIGTLTLDSSITPIVDTSNVRQGTVIELKDRTLELEVEQEVHELVSSVLAGDLTQRISLTGKDGFFASLSSRMNELIGVCEEAISSTIDVLSGLAQGDLTRKIEGDFQGSFSRLQQDVNSTIDRLTGVVKDIQGASKVVAECADEIASGNMNLSQRTEEQAANIEETASSMEEMTSTVQQNANNSAEADELAKSARAEAECGGVVVQDAVAAMDQISDASKKIANIIGVIDEIAFQTNLLALNASVEAARAGEQGRGFAVVAGEVRNLAGRSAEAAKEIKELIEDSVAKVDDGSRLVGESGETLNKIINSVQQVTSIIAEISNASREQTSGIEDISKTIAQLDEMTQQNAALVEEAAAASSSMGNEAIDLEKQVGFFRF